MKVIDLIEISVVEEVAISTCVDIQAPYDPIERLE